MHYVMNNKRKLLIEIVMVVSILLITAGIVIVTMVNMKKNKEAVENKSTAQTTEQTVVQETEAATTEATATQPVSLDAVAVERKKTEETTEQAAELTTTEPVPGSFLFQEPGIEDDTDPPFFLYIARSPKVEVGKNFDIHENMGYADDVDRDVELNVAGEVDTSTPGTYPLEITITDDTGKTASATMNVEVVEAKEPAAGAEGEPFETFANNYGGEGKSLGIDVSKWQGDIDFNRVKEAGCEYVIIRIGGYDDGSLYTDAYFTQNLRGAKAAGLKVGIYWHAEESSTTEAKASVDYIMNILGQEELDFPIAYDWEDFIHFEDYHMNLYDINACYEAFCDAVESYGYTACNYGSKNYMVNVWRNAENHPTWLAHYIDQSDYEGDYYMWQHSCTGLVPGIEGFVDLDILYNR